MTAAKHSIDSLAPQIALSAGAVRHRSTLESLGWRVALLDRAEKSSVLLIDMEDAPADLSEMVASHGGPAVAILGKGDAGVVDMLVTIGVRQFAPAADHLLLHAALKAAVADLRRDESQPEKSPRRRHTDNGTERLISWLAGISDRMQNATLILADFSSVEHINAAHGPASGDLVLSRASRRLAAFSRRIDMVGASLIRLSGSRFCLAVPQGLTADRVTFLLNELLADLHQPYQEGELGYHMPAVLAAVHMREGQEALRCVSRGLAALDRARGQSPAIQVDMAAVGDVPVADERQIEKDLRHAISRGEIEVVYQPQFAFEGDALVGVEALARWNHSKYGQLGAGLLFSVAARSDYLLPLSHHIHKTALAEAAEWSDDDGLRLSINVTPQDLAQPNFAKAFLKNLKSSGFSSEKLTLEITETGLMRDVEANARQLAELRRNGLRIAVDDFGTGYSSLAWLKQLPLDYIKIDQGLTADMLSEHRGRIIVQSVIALGRALDLTVIAEGVETEELRQLLADEGCDIYQGFLRAAPMSASDFITFAAADLGSSAK